MTRNVLWRRNNDSRKQTKAVSSLNSKSRLLMANGQWHLSVWKFHMEVDRQVDWLRKFVSKPYLKYECKNAHEFSTGLKITAEKLPQLDNWCGTCNGIITNKGLFKHCFVFFFTNKFGSWLLRLGNFYLHLLIDNQVHKYNASKSIFCNTAKFPWCCKVQCNHEIDRNSQRNRWNEINSSPQA